ncbi:MAG: PDDEXK nuclease domain-containing protein [Bacilli bacterium]|nr:PDDEXK nuclease domain-containing protein [Bacilli bacterium]
MEIQDKVKAVRKQLKMSQTAFAEELGIDYTTLSRIERGIFKPSYKFMEKLKEFCRKYNINLENNVSSLSVEIVNSSDLYADIVNVIDSSYSIANKTINYLLIQRNWLIGKRIVETELTNRKDDYGKSVIKELSKKLTLRYGKGFDERNLYFFTDFYLKFPNILNAVSSKCYLSWTHYRILLQVEDEPARKWYANEASKEAWSVRTLQRNISSQYYNRIISSLVKDQVHDEMIEVNTSNQQNKLDYIKDPMILEFLGLGENNTYLESDIEKAIISHLQKFLMELGKGYAFVARQQRIHTEKEDYYIDLVFYNYILKCFVLIDLKTSKITHQDVGQMDMYIRMYDELKKSSDDSPTLGIILCSDTDEDIAKYSILKGNEQLFASKYKLYLPSESELKEEIEREKMFYLEKKK